MSQFQPDDKVNTTLQRAIEALLLGDRPIAYHAALARSLHSVTAGVFLSQLLYWMPRGHNEDGWIWKTRDEIYRETALTRYEQEGARKILLKASVLEERLAGVPARMHFRINLNTLVQLLADQRDQPTNRLPQAIAERRGSQLVENQPTGWGNFHQPVRGKPANQLGVNQPTFNTETTTEITTENKSETPSSNSRKHSFSSTAKKQNPHPLPNASSSPNLSTTTDPANISLAPDDGSQSHEIVAPTGRDRGEQPALHLGRGIASVGEVLARRGLTAEHASGALTAPRASAVDQTVIDDPPGSAEGSPVKRGRPRKVLTDHLDAVIEEFSDELHDGSKTRSNIARARNLLDRSGLEEGDFVHYLYQARSITRDRGNIEKNAEGMEPLKNRFPYMMKVLEDLLDKRRKAKTDEAREIVDFTVQDFTSNLQGNEMHLADYQKQAYQLYEASGLDAETFVMRCHQARGELVQRGPRLRVREDGTTEVDRMMNLLSILEEMLRAKATEEGN